MNKYKSFRTIFFGFLILIKESTTNPFKNEKITCSLSLPAQIGQFPHTVVIKTNETGEIICRGTLIDVNWILTTAHCLSNIRLNDVTLTMGKGFQETIRKPKTVAVETKNRAALIEVDNPVKVTDTVAPIELATEGLSKNSKCIVSGLKKMTNNDTALVYWNMAVINKPKQTYNEIEMYFKDHAICREQLLWPSQKITENGMPLICNGRLYGIYTKNEPRVFFGLSKYNEWIRDVMHTTAVSALPDNRDLSANMVTNTTAATGDTEWTAESEDVVTEDVEETESDDPTSDTEEPTTRPVTASSSPTSPVVTVTEDVEETESDDPTSPPDLEEPTTRPVTVSSLPTSTAATVTEDVEETESDDPTSPPDEEETQPAFSTSPATTEFPTTAFKTISPITTTSTAAPSKDGGNDSNKSSSRTISYNASLIITILCCLAVFNKN